MFAQYGMSTVSSMQGVLDSHIALEQVEMPRLLMH